MRVSMLQFLGYLTVEGDASSLNGGLTLVEMGGPLLTGAQSRPRSRVAEFEVV